jgi:PilZ domain
MLRSPRTPIRRRARHAARIRCEVVRERDFRLVADRIVDLSESGARVMPADPTLTGERVIVSFRLPRSSYWIDAEAVVTRVAHGRRPGEHTRALGLEFEGLSGLSQRMLEKALRLQPPLPPGFRSGRRTTLALARFVAEISRRRLSPFLA